MTYARNDAVGRYGEQVAAAHLREAGMVILATRWSCRYGEIDLIALDAGAVVFCEVKTRTNDRYGTPAEGVSSLKAARLRRAAALYLQSHDLGDVAVRMEVVSVRIPPRGSAVVERTSGVA